MEYGNLEDIQLSVDRYRQLHTQYLLSITSQLRNPQLHI
jgi:hypothetical protein